MNEDTIKQLKSQVDLAASLKDLSLDSPRYEIWNKTNKGILRNISTEYLEIYNGGVIHRMSLNSGESRANFIRGINRKVEALNSIIDELIHNPDTSLFNDTKRTESIPASESIMKPTIQFNQHFSQNQHTVITVETQQFVERVERLAEQAEQDSKKQTFLTEVAKELKSGESIVRSIENILKIGSKLGITFAAAIKYLGFL